MIADALAPLAVPIDSLVLLDGNPRRGDIEAVARSLDRFGQRKPIVARLADRQITAGNHTYLAARQLGWTTIAVVWVDDDDATAKAFALADNRTHDLGTYDEAALAALLSDVAGYDDASLFAATGYDEAALAALLEAAAPLPPPPEVLTDPDDVPESAPALTQPGDVWRLGAHRVACGDCRDAEVWARLLDGPAPCCWTDPPYGIGYVGGGRAERAGTEREAIANDERMGADAMRAFLDDCFAALDAHLAPGARIYIAHPAGPPAVPFYGAVMARWRLHQDLVWVKHHFALGHADYHSRHEPLMLAYKPGEGGRWGRGAQGWYGDHAQTTVFEIDKPTASKLHPTMKPVDLITAMVVNSSAPDDVVVDPFGGSGSTLIACHALHRRARLIELSPAYVDVICRRFQEHTGAAPIRDGVPHNFTEGP